MTGFVFRLERVLRLRRAEKKQIQLELARVYGELNGVDVAREKLDKQLADARHAPNREHADRYCQFLEGEARTLVQREDELCLQAAALLTELDRASAKVKSLERLREKRLEAHGKCMRKQQEHERTLFRARRRILS